MAQERTNSVSSELHDQDEASEAHYVPQSYAPGVVPQSEAAKEGYTQNLWLHGADNEVTEVSCPVFHVFSES